MKTYQYLEVNPGKGIAFALIYMVIVVLIASFVFGGFFELANAVDNFGSAKFVGFLTGIIVIAPVFLLIRLVYPKVHIVTDGSQLTISRKKQQDRIIPFTDIFIVALNAQRMNTLTLYGRSGEVLISILPFNNHPILKQIAEDIISGGTFQKTVESKKLFNTSYEAITYRR